MVTAEEDDHDDVRTEDKRKKDKEKRQRKKERKKEKGGAVERNVVSSHARAPKNL